MVDQIGIDAANERAAFDAPLSTVWTPRLKPKAEGVVDQNSVSWNHIVNWLRGLEGLRRAA